jgi:hypothetical protein
MLTKSKFLELFRRQQESRLTVKEFCSNEAIAPATFYYWKKKLGKNNHNNTDFIPLVVKPLPTYPAGQNYASNPASDKKGP